MFLCYYVVSNIQDACLLITITEKDFNASFRFISAKLNNFHSLAIYIL